MQKQGFLNKIEEIILKQALLNKEIEAPIMKQMVFHNYVLEIILKEMFLENEIEAQMTKKMVISKLLEEQNERTYF